MTRFVQELARNLGLIKEPLSSFASNRIRDAQAIANAFPQFRDGFIKQAGNVMQYPMPPDEVLLEVAKQIKAWQAEVPPHTVLRGEHGKAEVGFIGYSDERTTTGVAGQASINILNYDDPAQMLELYPRENYDKRNRPVEVRLRRHT